MAYNSVRAVRPNLSTYHVSREEAAKFVTDGHATWANPQHTSINVMENGALRGLSCRVGSELACAYQQGKAWAQVQVAEIRQQHGPIAIEEDAGVLA